MYAITILYPAADGTTFDMDYYVGTHMPMFAEAIGTDNLDGWGVAQPQGNDYHCVAWAMVNDLDAYNASMAEHGKALIGDVANFTTSRPTMINTEVVATSA